MMIEQPAASAPQVFTEQPQHRKIPGEKPATGPTGSIITMLRTRAVARRTDAGHRRGRPSSANHFDERRPSL